MEANQYLDRPLFPCPLKGGQRIPYGSATYCENFIEEKDISARKAKVKKYQLCRQCLKSSQKVPNKIEDCRANRFSNCQVAHSRLICTNPIGGRRVYEAKEEEGDDFQDRYWYQDVMSDNLQYSFASSFHSCQ